MATLLIPLITSLRIITSLGDTTQKYIEFLERTPSLKLEAVIFDLDNTLINRKLAFAKYTELLIDKFIVHHDPLHKDAIMEHIQLADRDGYRRRQELFEEILQNFEMKTSDIAIETLLNHWFSEFFKCTVLMDGALEALEYLKKHNIKLGLITNGSIHSQNSKIDQVQLRPYFDVILVSDEVQLLKPDTRIFELVLNKLCVSPNSSWYVGDHPINDVQGALDAGLNAIWLSGFMAWEDHLAKPQYTIDSLHEIKGILAEQAEF